MKNIKEATKHLVMKSFRAKKISEKWNKNKNVFLTNRRLRNERY